MTKKHNGVAADPRRVAADSLVKWEKLGKYAPIEASSALNSRELGEADRRLYSALVYGVVERAITLDFIIDSYSSTPSERLEPIVRAALRIGLYQLLYMDRIPPHAAVSETVAIAPRRAAGLVNGVLRSFIRADKSFELPKKETDIFGYLSVKYSVPRDLCELLANAYGIDDAESILNCSFGGDRLCLRVNTLRCSVESAVERLKRDGAEVRVSSVVPDVLVMSSGTQFLSGIDEGLWFVQDEASAAAVMTLAPQAGSTVLDMCAAPGGKTFGCAVAMGDHGKITALDIHKNKLSLISDGAARLGLSIIEVGVGDAREPSEELWDSADFVLCDAPCSGLGVISKKPDIRYKSVKDISGLPRVQYAALCGAAKCVRSGGVLMYSTCTLNPAENEDIFRRFAESHPQFEPVPFDLCGLGAEGHATLMPHKTGTDGFFISKFRRKY